MLRVRKIPSPSRDSQKALKQAQEDWAQAHADLSRQERLVVESEAVIAELRDRTAWLEKNLDTLLNRREA